MVTRPPQESASPKPAPLQQAARNRPIFYRNFDTVVCVTADLDDGPIIEQEVVRVEHFHSPDDLLRIGRDCERQALARGVRWHLMDRVLMHGKRTVVFRD